MAQQIQGGTTYGSTSPSNQVNASNLNALANDATLLVGAVTSQPTKTARTNVADTVLGYDSQDGAATTPKQFPLSDLVPEVVANGSQNYAVGSFAAGNYTVTLSPVPSAYIAGMEVRFKAGANNTGTTQINVNGLGLQTILTSSGANLQAGQIPNGAVVELIYDGSNFYIVGITPPTYGADVYSADTGSANSYVVTLTTPPTAYFAGMTVRFKANNANTGASAVNVNSLGSKTIVRPNGGALQSGDIPSGAIVVLTYDGTNFQLTSSTKLGANDFVSTAQAVVQNNTTYSVAHSLPAVPTRVRWVMRCGTGEFGYSSGDEVDVMSLPQDTNASQHFTLGANATNVFLVLLNSGNIRIIRKDTNVLASITVGSWNFFAYANL